MKINFKKCTVISDNQINNAYSLLVLGGKRYEIPHFNLHFSFLVSFSVGSMIVKNFPVFLSYWKATYSGNGV